MAVKVLFVDDDPIFLQAQKAFFTKRGLTVFTAVSQSKALEILQTNKPDIIFLDLMMEHHDSGFHLCHQIKDQLGLTDVPVILLTGVASATGFPIENNFQELATWAKIDGYLAKPVAALQILVTIKRHVTAAKNIALS